MAFKMQLSGLGEPCILHFAAVGYGAKPKQV